MKPSIKPCPAPDCKAHIPAHTQFCNEDFRRLPREIKDRITQARDKRDTLATAQAVNDGIKWFVTRKAEINAIQDYRA